MLIHTAILLNLLDISFTEYREFRKVGGSLHLFGLRDWMSMGNGTQMLSTHKNLWKKDLADIFYQQKDLVDCTIESSIFWFLVPLFKTVVGSNCRCSNGRSRKDLRSGKKNTIFMQTNAWSKLSLFSRPNRVS